MFFMPAPEEEAALLEALADFLAPCQALVTFNGKSFDAPLLKTRYALHSIPCPFDDFAHIDLLPLARRLWRDRLPSRALKALEVDILNAPRGPEEVPGYEIPYLYFDYLRSGDPAPLKGVFYHNGLDVVSMAALLNHTAALLDDPHQADLHGLDILALARLFADLRRWDDAARLYERALESGLPEASFADAIKRYATLQRRRGDWETAIKLWERAAGEGHIYAHVELAKHAEHRQRDISLALRWTDTARQLANAPALPDYIRAYWLVELEHRRARLERKNEK
jgi:tetratricopeptide (TPR) repeat protein